MRVIGLTGGIASGKSTVTQLLRQNHIPVLDADAIAWQLAQPERALWQAYVEHYGDRVLLPDRQLNRQAVADIVFSQPEEKQWMDGMAHPIIKKEIQKQLSAAAQAGERLAVLDVPLLYEAGWDNMVDQVWLVYVNKEVQLQRLMARNGYSRQEALRRISAQMPLEEKRKKAQAVLDNNGTRQELEAMVMGLLDKQKEWQCDIQLK